MCPFRRRMKASYEACILKYSDESFFSVADLRVASYISFDVNATNIATMNATRWRLMGHLAGKASGSPLHLANGSEKFEDSNGRSQVMYELVQCMRDLNASECMRCLTNFVAILSSSGSNHTYGAVKGFSYYVVYQIGQDLTITIPPAPPPLMQPSAPSTTTPQLQGQQLSIHDATCVTQL
jgi:hypothetical protein